MKMQLGTINEVDNKIKEKGSNLNIVEDKRLRASSGRRKSGLETQSDKNTTSNSETSEKPKSQLIQNLSTKLEIRRKSEELESLDALEREAFNQTLIYAAKSALSSIQASKVLEPASENNEIGSEVKQEKVEETDKFITESRPTSRNKCKNCNSRNSAKTGRNNRRDSYSADSSRKCSACEIEQDFKRMATRKKSTRRKESVILIPVKEVKNLTPAQISEIKKSFNDLDVNKDGRVSKRELMIGAYRLGMNPTDDDVDSMFKSADKNGDGFIDFNEYVDMMKQNYVTIDIERERMKAAFAMLDFDGDGYISKEELVKSLVTKQSGITEADIDDILRDADMDGNDQIDFNEFVDSTICAKLF